MSKKEKVTEQKNKAEQEKQTEEKVMTKYDLKMQRRKEQKEKEKKQERVSMIVGIVIVVALVCLVISFPLRSYMAVHGTVIRINGEKISQVEFDYNYNVVVNNFRNSGYASYFGPDFSSDLSTQMYSQTLSWKDYFEQETVSSLIREKSLKAQADAAGFTYDTKEEYDTFQQNVKDTADSAGITVKDLLQQMYGSYATIGRIKDMVEESIYANAYYTQISEEKTPSEAEIQAYYEEHKNNYDSVDYYLTLVEAELPTKPTELADPVEETDEAAADTEEQTYQPSEAEIEKAMADAKKLADAAEDVVKTDGELRENEGYYSVSYLTRDWLFDETRKEGDTTVIEDMSGHQYYVLSFVKRYLDETPSADVRIISTDEENGQAILEEWQTGEATEESFGLLADKYNEGTSFTAEGGFYEAVSPSGTHEQIAEWLFDAGRKAGDTTVITTEEGYTYVLYYVGSNEPEWILDVRNTVLSDVMEAYLEEISADAEVEDSKGNLEYLKKQAAEDAEAEESSAENSEDGTEDSAEESDTADSTEAE